MKNYISFDVASTGSYNIIKVEVLETKTDGFKEITFNELRKELCIKNLNGIITIELFRLIHLDVNGKPIIVYYKLTHISQGYGLGETPKPFITEITFKELRDYVNNWGYEINISNLLEYYKEKHK